jgi:DNA-binding CsgD family transcriptional regulator
LTPREAHLLRLASSGLTSADIGTQLRLSPYTVEWYLRKIFTKLGTASRMQLGPPDS